MCGSLYFFFNDTATTEIYTLSLHDALPISACSPPLYISPACRRYKPRCPPPCASHRRSRSVDASALRPARSEEHTSELQSHSDLVCRLLLEKKKEDITSNISL